MLATRATVIKTEGSSAWVITQQVSGCEQCNWRGCGATKVAQIFCQRAPEFSVENPIAAKVGDEVILHVEEGAMLHSIAKLYLLPLLLLAIGAGLGEVVGQHGDISVAVGGGVGLLLGFYAVKYWRVNYNVKKTYIAVLAHSI
jgi:sigma-E factor negative regulatory protein RseC